MRILFVIAVPVHMSPSLTSSYAYFFLYLAKGSSLHLLSIRSGRKKNFGRFYHWFFWKGCWWLFFKTLMENFNTEAFHPGNGAFARKQKKGEGSLKEQLNLAFQLHCKKKP